MAHQDDGARVVMLGQLAGRARHRIDGLGCVVVGYGAACIAR